MQLLNDSRHLYLCPCLHCNKQEELILEFFNILAKKKILILGNWLNSCQIVTPSKLVSGSWNSHKHINLNSALYVEIIQSVSFDNLQPFEILLSHNIQTVY